jgi:hypothetical protein
MMYGKDLAEGDLDEMDLDELLAELDEDARTDAEQEGLTKTAWKMKKKIWKTWKMKTST